MHRRSTPGACLVGVWPAVAAVALAFNVDYLRTYHPGVLSGKLSDLAINFLLPVVLVAGVEWLWALASIAGAPAFRPLGRWGQLAACTTSAVYFGLLKLMPAFTEVHRVLLKAMDFPFGGGRTFRNTPDPTDLLTLVMTPLAAWYLARRSRTAHK